jgi:uncharacterized protein (DUF433 family)
MASIVPLEMIEIEDRPEHKVTRIAGTRIRVAEIVQMHVYNNTPIDWIVENYEVLDYGRVHAALAYYYTHREQIEAELRYMHARDAELEATAMTLDKLKHKLGKS